MKAHILLVEDDIDLRSCLAEVLRDEGYEISEADTGVAAISLLRAQPGIDLVVSDYLMPEGTGLDVLRHLQAGAEPRPRFFLMTGQAEVRLEEAKRLGVQEFVLKPFDVPELLGAIDRCLRAR